MSVLACNRKNCANVMCDRHSNTYGWICNNCFEVLVANKKADSWYSIDEFMETDPDYDFDPEDETVRQELEEEFTNE